MTKQEQALAALGLTTEEIADVIKADKEIDRGAKLFELDPEREKGAKKARQAERKQTTPTKREKKTDNDKRFLIDSLVSAMTSQTPEELTNGDLVQAELLEITNSEREFLFMYNGKKYKVVLSCPRS